MEAQPHHGRLRERSSAVRCNIRRSGWLPIRWPECGQSVSACPIVFHVVAMRHVRIAESRGDSQRQCQEELRP